MEALRSGIDLNYFILPNNTHFKLTTTIHHHVKISPIKWKMMHVRVDQDDNPFCALDR